MNRKKDASKSGLTLAVIIEGKGAFDYQTSIAPTLRARIEFAFARTVDVNFVGREDFMTGNAIYKLRLRPRMNGKGGRQHGTEQ